MLSQITRPRIYADFNSRGDRDAYWLLLYGPDKRPIDEVAEELGLREGMLVTLFYREGPWPEPDGEIEEFEVTAVIVEFPTEKRFRWRAIADWSTRRDISP